MGGRSVDRSLLPRRLNRKIGKVLHDYRMLAEGDRVLIGVSGGVDSAVLAWLLSSWRAKAPIHYSLQAVFIDDDFPVEAGRDRPAVRIARQMARLNVDLVVEKAWPLAGERNCYLCARNRRSQLFDLARRRHCNRIALGHHLDDLIETLYLNMLYSGNISTMVPKQELFGGELAIIRPLAYLDKQEVRGLAERLALEEVKNTCPQDGESRRTTVRRLLEELYAVEPGAKASLLQAMKNVRREYLL